VPPPTGVTPPAWRVFALFTVTIAGLVIQPFPAAAVVLIGTALFIVVGHVPLTEALSAFAQPSVWMLFGAMLMARALIDTGLSRRLALWFVRYFGHTSLGIVYSLVMTDLSLAGAVPAITARSGGIILPIAHDIGALYNSSSGSTAPLLGKFLMAALYQASVIACAMFLTGQAGNLLAATFASQLAGVNVTWSSWLIAASVPGLICLIIIPYVAYRILPPVIKHTPAAGQFALSELEKMGAITGPERVVGIVVAGMCVLWATGEWTGIHSTTIALGGIAILLVANVLSWDRAAGDQTIWDVFIWYGCLVMMGEQLNQTKVPYVFASWIGGWFDGLAWFPVLLGTVLVYFYSHYAFATVTVHVLALFPPFVALLIGVGVPPKLAVYSLCCLAALPAGLTHYGTTTAPLFIRGYVSVPDWWKVGFVASVVNLAIWLTIGLAWWKLLGFW
jgi:DASS family divalent anion:Na+ symporter